MVLFWTVVKRQANQANHPTGLSMVLFWTVVKLHRMAKLSIKSLSMVLFWTVVKLIVYFVYADQSVCSCLKKHL